MEQKILIRITANGFDKQLSMKADYYDAMKVDSSQLSMGYLRDACHHMRNTLENKGDILVHRVSAVAVIFINGMALTSSRVVETYV